MKPWPHSRKARLAEIAIGLILLTPLVLYFILLGEEKYSAWEASKMLDDLETIRVGDPASNFDRAVRGCTIERINSNALCFVTAGAFRWAAPWIFLAKLPARWAPKLSELRDRSGLRYWRLAAFSTIQDGRIRNVSVLFHVAGSYEALGASWGISDRVPARYAVETMSADQQRTYMGWYHITSKPSGEGFMIQATPASTGKELRARNINHSCLFSSHGCDGLCELLPDAVSVLKERGSSWGGGTGATPTKCAVK
jgi:hypothetical protein